MTLQERAEGAARAAAQFYELWIKSIVRARDPQWLQAHPRANIPAVLRCLDRIHELSEKTLRGIDNDPANQIKHDLKYTMKTAEAANYVDEVVAATWDTLMSLVGADVWKRGEAGELNHLGMGASDKQFADVFTYHQHYRLQREPRSHLGDEHIASGVIAIRHSSPQCLEGRRASGSDLLKGEMGEVSAVLRMLDRNGADVADALAL